MFFPKNGETSDAKNWICYNISETKQAAENDALSEQIKS